MGGARRRVIGALAARGAPVTADELAGDLPDVHVSTVYRTLAVLEDVGLVTHVHLAHGPAVYELGHLGGHHLVCSTCGRDLVVPDAVFDEVRWRIADEYGFVIDADHFAIAGHCVACAPSPSLQRP
jgi:Fur family ferric uptake transcriptional regulator